MRAPVSTPTQGLALGFPVGFTGLLAVETAEHKGWSPQATPPPLLPQAPPSPWMASEAEAPLCTARRGHQAPVAQVGARHRRAPRLSGAPQVRRTRGSPSASGTRAAVPAQLRVLHQGRQGEAPGAALARPLPTCPGGELRGQHSRHRVGAWGLHIPPNPAKEAPLPRSQDGMGGQGQAARPGPARSTAPSRRWRWRGMETGWFPHRELFSG